MNSVYIVTRFGFPRKEGPAQDRLCSFLLEDDRLAEVRVWQDSPSLLGNIYVGKVKNILNNIEAAFVEIEGSRICFLPFSEVQTPVLTNRVYEGRLLAGDEILVQVKKDAVKTKDPVLTAKLSVTGQYAALALDGGHGVRYSHKLDEEAKERAKTALSPVKMPSGMTLIVRTQTQELSDMTLLTREVLSLQERAKRLLTIGKTRTVFSLISEEQPGYLRHLQECRIKPDKIVTDEISVYTALQNSPEAGGTLLSFYREEALSLCSLYGLAAKLEEAVCKKVWLKSGGYLVIEPTEALTVIDVNSGKYAGKKKTEETFSVINEEAALETARQLRLRNLSGIIIVDFISLERKEDSRRLLSLLREACSRDPVPVRVVDMTPLGLVEITRKKIERPLSEQWR